MVKLTSVQEAAFNAAAEAARELGLDFNLHFYAAGVVGAYGYLDPANSSSKFVHTPSKPTGSESVQAFLDALAEEQAKPPVFTKPVEVRDAVAKMVEEYRERDQAAFSRADIDELADRVAALPVKE